MRLWPTNCTPKSVQMQFSNMCRSGPHRRRRPHNRSVAHPARRHSAMRRAIARTHRVAGGSSRRASPRRRTAQGFSEVLKAKQESQTALERARGESAALRNLVNAPRLIASQPALATVRFPQTLEASNASQTFVMDELSALLPALNARGAKPSATELGEPETKTVSGKQSLLAISTANHHLGTSQSKRANYRKKTAAPVARADHAMLG